MRVIFACTNFNTDDKLKLFLSSIYEAKLNCVSSLSVDVLIGDNSEVFNEVEFSLDDSIRIYHINNHGNFGYIGGIYSAIQSANIQIENADYFIISNVDLVISNDFFSCLTSLEISSNVGWISPSIISEKEQRDRNPKILYRPTRKKLILTSFMFKFPMLHWLYSNILYKRHNKRLKYENENEIYAGHGSFMIFTSEFLHKNTDFNFPSFLFGEEIFFAELIRNSFLKTIYLPNLKIFDFDHVSTSKLKRKDYYHMNYNSLKVLINTYFCNE